MRDLTLLLHLLLPLLLPLLLEGVAATSGERALGSSPDGSVSAGSPYNPMNPFLSLKPFLPSKPTFFPPVVDPNYFIGQKAALLNNLFTPKTAGSFTGTKTEESGAKRTLPATSYSTAPFDPNLFISKKTAFLNQLFKQLATPAPDTTPGTIQDVPTTVDPNIVLYKKMGMLTMLLKQLESSVASTTPATKRAVPTDDTADTLKNLLLSGALLKNDYEDSAAPTTENPLFMPSFGAAKPTIVPPSFWSAFAKPTAVPPSFWSAFAKPTPPVKPTIVPPGFWLPFLQPASTTVKPTIVPPSFWLPFAPSSAEVNKSSASPFGPATFIDKKTKFLQTLFSTLQTTPTPTTDPADIYAEKVNEYLDTLFSSVQTGETSGVSVRKVLPPTSMDSISSLMNAKSKITSSIISEMMSVKNTMVDTVDDMVKKQKEAMTAASSFVPGKKPFASPYASMWSPGSAMGGKPTPDPTAPLKQKLKFLDSLFDSLAKMQKDVTDSVNTAVSSLAATATPSTNSLLLALLKNSTKVSPTSSSSSSDQAALDELQRRGIKMAVHQGYQSLPPGAEEVLQAGGGGEVEGHEGGGLRLQDLLGTSQEVSSPRHHGHHSRH